VPILLQQRFKSYWHPTKAMVVNGGLLPGTTVIGPMVFTGWVQSAGPDCGTNACPSMV